MPPSPIPKIRLIIQIIGVIITVVSVITTLVLVYAATPDPSSLSCGEQTMRLNNVCTSINTLTHSVLITPYNIHVFVPSGLSGTVVEFDVSVFYKEVIDVNCIPSSGSFFELGQTLVECKAFDRFGAGVVAIFPVEVETLEGITEIEMITNYGYDAISELFLIEQYMELGISIEQTIIIGIITTLIGIVMIYYGRKFSRNEYSRD